MKIRCIRRRAFTLVEIMIVVAIIGLLAAIAIPNFVRARTAAQLNACINNLRQIDGAKQMWALETRQTTNALPVETDIGPFLRGAAPSNIVCPSGGITATFSSSYDILSVSEKPLCKILTTHTLP